MRKREISKLRILSALALLTLILSSTGMTGVDSALAQDGPPPEVEVINEYFTVEHLTMPDGTQLEKAAINGPPEPPLGWESLRQDPGPLPSDGLLSNFPAYSWVFGCSAVSGAMIAAYYDRNGYPNMYTGPTDGGVMPLTDTSWSTWTDSEPHTYPNNPLIASKAGVDGRSASLKGSIDDYWVKFGHDTDPYVTGSWTQHTWSDAIGDYMKTSQSAYGSTDGSTSFYGYYDPVSSTKLTCTAMDGYGILDDGTQGRRDFYQARGYTVSECYNQMTYNTVSGGFSLADLQAEIDAGHPVLINVTGHSMVA